MNLEQNRRWRSRVGLAGALFGLVFLLSAIDGLSVHFREQGLVIHALADEAVKLSGPLRQELSDPNELTFVSDSNEVAIKFEEIYRDYWLGGLKWRGRLVVDRNAAPGDYRISVFRKFAGDQRPFSSYLVKVYPDAAALRRASKSLLESRLGVSPWVIFALTLASALASFGVAFYLGQLREKHLAKERKAEIFRVIQSPEGSEVHFTLGRKDGVQPDSRLSLLDDKGNFLTTLQVKQITETDSSATVHPDQKVKLGYIVALN
jgi:hypothetical protein